MENNKLQSMLLKTLKKSFKILIWKTCFRGAFKNSEEWPCWKTSIVFALVFIGFTIVAYACIIAIIIVVILCVVVAAMSEDQYVADYSRLLLQVNGQAEICLDDGNKLSIRALVSVSGRKVQEDPLCFRSILIGKNRNLEFVLNIFIWFILFLGS